LQVSQFVIIISHSHTLLEDTFEELLAEYPLLEHEDILACPDYAASATQPPQNSSASVQAVAQFAAEEWLGLLVTMRDVVQSIWRASGAEIDRRHLFSL
jgi:hypothetical protein